VVRGTFSPARAWRPAVVSRLPRTLGRAKHTSWSPPQKNIVIAIAQNAHRELLTRQMALPFLLLLAVACISLYEAGAARGQELPMVIYRVPLAALLVISVAPVVLFQSFALRGAYRRAFLIKLACLWCAFLTSVFLLWAIKALSIQALTATWFLAWFPSGQQGLLVQVLVPPVIESVEILLFVVSALVLVLPPSRIAQVQGAGREST
jgi:hypothetical protein